MDFHAAIETFAEAWVAANTPTAVNSDKDSKPLSSSFHEPPTMLPKEKLASIYGQKSAGNPSIYGQKSSGNTSIYGHPSSRSSSPDLSSTTSDATPPPVPVQTSPSVSPATKSLPIHVIIEQTSAPPTFEGQECGSPSEVELDSYAILPCNTLFCDLVRSALVKLGYTSAQTVSAKGAIQIKNWQPLSFDVISTDKKASIEDILGELTQVATLRIRLCSNKKMSSTDEIKGKLLQLLLNHSHGLLLSSGCPIEKEQLSTITRDSSFADLPVELRRAFDVWYQSQVQKIHKMDEEGLSSADESREKATTNGLDLSELHNGHSQNHTGSLSGLVKTRMRTSFDPEHEIPRLQKWFQNCQHPSREQMIRYLGELNSLDSRKGRRPLDLTNIIYWFKNARAAHRRASRNFDDNSFEDDNVDTTVDREKSVPYLPNKNAVYVVPYPYHGSGPFLSSDVLNDREPCDLSHRKVSTSPEVKVENVDKDVKPSIPEQDKVERRQEKSPASEKTVKLEPGGEKAMDCSIHHLNGEHREFSRLRSQDQESCRSNGTHLSENSSHDTDSDELEDDEGMESDVDSVSKGSQDSSHPHMLTPLKHDYPEASDYLSSHMTHLQSSAGRGLTQPLHIPHFPHPLAMHYFPMNTHYLTQHSPASRLHQHQHSPSQLSPHQKTHGGSHRKRRTRVFIDPMTEIPKLEKWFLEDTHPSSYMIDKYCEELNHSEYRQKFPKLEAKNVQLWFKNHRAKVKRMRVSQVN